jgi:MFS family permease
MGLSPQANLEAIAFFMGTIMELPSGALADLIGRKASIIIGWFITATSHILLGLSFNSFFYVLWSLLGGFGGAFISGADTALIYDSLKQENKESEFAVIQSKAMVLYRIGIIVATFTGGFIYKIDNRLPYVLMGIFELIGMLFLFLLKEPNIDSIKFTWSRYLQTIIDGIKQFTKNSHNKLLAIYYLIIGGISFSSLFFFNYSYAVDLGFDGIKQSYLFGISGITKALIVYFLSKYFIKIGKKRILWIFPIFMILFYLPAVYAPFLLAVLIIIATDTIAAARMSVLDQIVNDELESKSRATALSFLNMLVSIVYMAILFSGGIIVEKYGTSYLYTILGTCLILLIPITYKLTKHH